MLNDGGCMAGGNQIVIECDPLWLKAIATVYYMDCPSSANRTRSPRTSCWPSWWWRPSYIRAVKGRWGKVEIRPFDDGVRVKSWWFEVNWISQCRYCSGKAAMHYCYGDALPCQTEVEPCHSVGNSQGGLKQGGHVLYLSGYRSALLMHHHAMRLTECSEYFKLIRSTSNSFDTVQDHSTNFHDVGCWCLANSIPLKVIQRNSMMLDVEWRWLHGWWEPNRHRMWPSLVKSNCYCLLHGLPIIC